MANSPDDDKTLTDLAARLDEIAMLRAAINSQLSPSVSPPASETKAASPKRERALRLVPQTPPTDSSNEGNPE